jgi:hypothetical protein
MAPAAKTPLGPFIIRSRKGNFGNQDRMSALRMALTHRQDADLRFVDIPSGRCFTPVGLIDALDDEDAAMAGPPPTPPESAAGAAPDSFRSFATATVDIAFVPPAPPPSGAPSDPATGSEASRRSGRHGRRSDRIATASRRSEGGMLWVAVIGALAVAMLAALLAR